MKKTIFALLMPVIITGCATTDLPSKYALDENSGRSIAVAGVTLSGAPLSRFAGFELLVRERKGQSESSVNVKPYYHSVTGLARTISENSKHRQRHRSFVIKGPASNESLDIVEEDKATGRVAVLELPPGDYEVYGWRLRERTQFGGLEYTPVMALSHGFRVEPGEGHYLGRFDLDFTAEGRPRMAIDDRRAEDLSAISTRYARVDVARISSDDGADR
ncbi:hypothetical protein [Denitromonas sp.]|uniref:hypothetical protein n=1 Tax=Denitromonas sp. TaxID=2734609 RepID=UPI002AFF5FB4|nr:hypothetical protein [Denitromonas sp.]